ncbi:MAG: hypothetical protein EAZ91_16625 [Cytophagales bacterium]|nr:MAG: hypothetical protein EAZ91_16625 [Cytophagales bacterium]
MREGLVTPDNSNIETIKALSPDKKTLFVVLMNNRTEPTSATVRLQPEKIRSGNGRLTGLTQGKSVSGSTVTLPPFGVEVWQYVWQ